MTSIRQNYLRPQSGIFVSMGKDVSCTSVLDDIVEEYVSYRYGMLRDKTLYVDSNIPALETTIDIDSYLRDHEYDDTTDDAHTGGSSFRANHYIGF